MFFVDILKIYHLWHFTSLTKLQLDNNVIERIEGLENLTNLVWLGEFRLSCQYQNRCGHYESVIPVFLRFVIQ